MIRAAFANSLIIAAFAESFPGWTEGGNKANITVQLHYDLLCVDSKAQDVVIK